VVVLATMILIRRHREKLTSDIGYARSRKASKAARRRLARAKSMAKVEQAGEFYAEIYTALTSYIADKFNISPHGLTMERIAELLRTKGADEALIEDVADLVQKCDFARFAPASMTQEDIDQSLAMAEQTMTRIEGIKLA